MVAETSLRGKDEAFTPGIYGRGSSPSVGHPPGWLPWVPRPPRFLHHHTSLPQPPLSALLVSPLPMYTLPKRRQFLLLLVGFSLFKLHLHAFNSFFTIPPAVSETCSSGAANTSCVRTSRNSLFSRARSKGFLKSSCHKPRHKTEWKHKITVNI